MLTILLYIDSGTGSIIAQIVIATITAVLFYLSIIRKKVADLFSGIFRFFAKNKND